MKLLYTGCHGSVASFKTADGLFQLELCAPNIARVTYEKSPKTDVASPLEITRPVNAPEWVSNLTEKSVTLKAPDFSVAVDLNTGRLVWREDDRLLTEQPFPTLDEQPVIRYTTGGEPPVIRRVKTVDGERSFVENLRPEQDRIAYRSKVFFQWQEGEALHGLGQGEEGIYDYRGKVQYLYQHNMRIPVPFLLSSRGYGVLFDCGSLMTFNDDERGSYLFLDTVDRLDYYLIAGSADESIAGFRLLTGSAALLPKWAYGYIQSKEAYQTQDELVAVAEEYRRRHIPLDCVVQDWHTWTGDAWGNKHVDKARFPDLPAANRKLHDLQVHSMVSVWPNMNEGCADHTDFTKAGWLLGDNSTYDAFRPEARKLYWKQAESELFSGGFDSWWCDSTEPFSGPDWGGPTLREPWERYQLVGGEHKKYFDAAQANLFAVKHAQGIYENQRQSAPEKRVLNLTRSGYAGSQKFGAVLWSGDISARWDVLEKQIAEGLNMCMSGIPWWTLDIGGFFTVREAWQNRGCFCNTDPSPLWFWNGDYNEGVRDPAYRELYVRWLQLGTFLPMFRSHGTDTPREIWNFGEPGTPYYDAIEKFIRLRYRLMPYIYSEAANVALDNQTMLRSLLFDFPDDPNAVKMADAFLFGKSLLVYPITRPMENGHSVRHCYLPKGLWYDFWTGEALEGGRFLDVDVPLDQIPVYVRAGTVLPMETAQLEYACQDTDEPLELRIYPGADGDQYLYEDSGDGYDYEKGIYNRIQLHWDDSRKVLSLGKARCDFPQSLHRRGGIAKLGDMQKGFSYIGEPIEISFEA